MPLTDLKVLDLTRLIPGAYATMILADFGADVLKVEEPGRGDYMRWFEPTIRHESSAFLIFNRNKRSMTLNLKHEQGKDIFRRLILDADVLLEGYRPGVMERLGFDYSAVARINPRLIYCSISGCGQDGPYRLRAGHDINYIGLSGILAHTGTSPASMPVSPGIPIGDLCGGALQAVIGILLALSARHRTGKGQYVDVAMLDGILPLVGMEAAVQFACGKSTPRGHSLFSGGYLCNTTFQTRDGRYVTLGILEEKFWHDFCDAVGRPDWKDEEYLADKSDNQSLYQALVQMFLERTRDEWVEFCA